MSIISQRIAIKQTPWISWSNYIREIKLRRSKNSKNPAHLDGVFCARGQAGHHKVRADGAGAAEHLVADLAPVWKFKRKYFGLSFGLKMAYVLAWDSLHWEIAYNNLKKKSQAHWSDFELVSLFPKHFIHSVTVQEEFWKFENFHQVNKVTHLRLGLCLLSERPEKMEKYQLLSYVTESKWNLKPFFKPKLKPKLNRLPAAATATAAPFQPPDAHLEEEGLRQAAVEARLAGGAEAVHGAVRNAAVLRRWRRNCKENVLIRERREPVRLDKGLIQTC